MVGWASHGPPDRRRAQGWASGLDAGTMGVDPQRYEEDAMDTQPQEPQDDAGTDEPLREEDVTRADALDDRVEEGDGLPEG
jgi:hypothetical protein